MNRIIFLITAFAVLITPFALGRDTYVSIKGQKLGQFRGEGATASTARISCVAFEYGVKAPRDVATGQSSGKRQHGTVRIVKEWGACSPTLLTALVTNEHLTSIEFLFTKIDPKTGQATVYQKMNLTDATISEIRQFVAPPGSEYNSTRFPIGMEEVHFTVDKVALVTHIESGASSMNLTGGTPGKQPDVRPTGLRVPPPANKTK